MLKGKDMRNVFYNQINSICLGKNISEIYNENAEILISHPFNKLNGHEEIQNFWEKLFHTLPDIERRDSIFVMGNNFSDERSLIDIEGTQLVASISHYQGTFDKEFLGIPASKKVVYLRSCEVHQFSDDRIIKSYMLLDFLNLMNQVGLWPISPSLGTDFFWPIPATCDGVRISENISISNGENYNTVMKMHKALGEYDGQNIESMKHAQYWSKNFLWYGPAGIGTSKGMKNFRNFHQVPFLRGFPDRKGASHYIRIEDGNYVVTGGWPSVEATHGGEWLGIPATNKRIKMRVMDFYRLENNRIVENWVPIDIIHILYQMGFDVFGRLKEMRIQEG